MTVYLTTSDIKMLPQFWNGILSDLLDLLAKNLNHNRVFIPTLTTLSKLFGEAERFGWNENSLSNDAQEM
jgi:hypothetical protein